MFDDLPKVFKPAETTDQQNNETEPKEKPENPDKEVAQECQPLVELNQNNNTTVNENQIANLDQGIIVPYVPNFDENPLADDNFLKMIENIERQKQNVVFKSKCPKCNKSQVGKAYFASNVFSTQHSHDKLELYQVILSKN